MRSHPRDKVLCKSRQLSGAEIAASYMTMALDSRHCFDIYAVYTVCVVGYH